MPRAVIRTLKCHPVIVDIGVEREHLEPTRIGQREAVPSRKLTESAQCGDGFRPRAQHEVIGVAEHNLRTERGVIISTQVLDRTADSTGRLST